GELSTKPHIDAPAVSQVPHISKRPGVDREYQFMIDLVEDELVSRLLDMLIASVKGISPALVVCLDEERLRLAVPTVSVLSPYERVRPVRVGPQRHIIYQ